MNDQPMIITKHLSRHATEMMFKFPPDSQQCDKLVRYGVSGMGGVCHTLNPRLFADDIIFLVSEALHLLNGLNMFIDTA